MKKFMHVLLATFGIMALVFAGCEAVEEESTDEEMMEAGEEEMMDDMEVDAEEGDMEEVTE
jgi:hypothetical protein